MMAFFNTLYQFFYWGLFIYSVTLMGSYIILGLISLSVSINYLRRNSFVDYHNILSSPMAPSVSIIAPAFNESKTIIDNVRSLLAINYNNYDVIIVNDGSTDDSLQKLINTYQLAQVTFVFGDELKTNAVRGIYRSVNKAYRRLTVVDKENGGKSDALNAGIVISQKRYIACVDVDCVIEPDALLRMIKPFMEDTRGQVIATGGVVRIANSCIVEDGRLVRVELPQRFLPRVQTLEYIRAFLLGRMAWSRLNGLLLISGAFGLFDRELVINCGGYNVLTVGEDMELVVRMRRYMHKRRRKYKIVYIPDPLCWTEAPDSYKVLAKQRNRWTRGTAETLWMHRGIAFNAKYRFLGMVSYPYWFLYEWLAPVIETLGILHFLLLALLGYVNWPFFFLLLALVYSFAIMFSVLAILSEELTFQQYKKEQFVFKLLFTALLEPILFHPWGVISAIRGNIDLLTGKKSWGRMNRSGFDSETAISKTVSE